MPRPLREEIRQNIPFERPEEEAFVSISRTAAVLGHALGEAFKPFGITATQYNVLRILRGAGKAGLCRNEVRDRLIAQVPDVTRLLDRMEAAGLIARQRDEQDRRLVTTTITQSGIRLLDRLKEPVAEVQRQHLGHMTPGQLATLNDLLSIARGGG